MRVKAGFSIDSTIKPMGDSIHQFQIAECVDLPKREQ